MIHTDSVGIHIRKLIVYPFVQVFRTLVENTKGIKGAKVENHKFCASVHYRNVDEKVPNYIFFIA